MRKFLSVFFLLVSYSLTNADIPIIGSFFKFGQDTDKKYKYRILELESTVQELRIVNSVLVDRVDLLKKSVLNFKEQLVNEKKESQAIRKSLLSQILELEKQHEQEKQDLVEEMEESNIRSVNMIRKELTESFKAEKEELIEEMDAKVESVRDELTEVIDNAIQEIGVLKQSLRKEKDTTNILSEKLDIVTEREQSSRKEVESLKRALKTEAMELKDSKPVTPVINSIKASSSNKRTPIRHTGKSSRPSNRK